MEEVLRENDWKGGWKDCPLGYLMKRMKDEDREFRAAVKRRDLEGALHEIIDGVNFRMMAWDVLRKKRGKLLWWKDPPKPKEAP
jgi:hypothetical protein